MLRKPGSSTSSNFLKKKPSSGISKLRVNKLSMKAPSSGNSNNDDFEDIETTQKSAAAAGKEAKQMKEDEATAKKMQIELDAAPPAPAPVVEAPVPYQYVPPPPPVVVAAKKPEPPKKLTMKENVSKMQDMNKDFFSQF